MCAFAGRISNVLSSVCCANGRQRCKCVSASKGSETFSKHLHLLSFLFIVSLYCYELENRGVRSLQCFTLKNFVFLSPPFAIHINLFPFFFFFSVFHKTERPADVDFISGSLFIFIRFHFNRSHSHRNGSISSRMVLAVWLVAGEIVAALSLPLSSHRASAATHIARTRTYALLQNLLMKTI